MCFNNASVTTNTTVAQKVNICILEFLHKTFEFSDRFAGNRKILKHHARQISEKGLNFSED